MAGMRDVVVHVNDAVASAQAVDVAARVAVVLGAGLTAVLAAEPIRAGVGLSPETTSLAQQLDQAQRASLQAIGQRLADETRQRHGLDLTLCLADGDPVEALRAHSRVADLLVNAQRDPAGAGGLAPNQLARLLVGAACPVLTVPYIGWAAAGGAPAPAGRLARALVAWADTRESARALRDALPLLARASSVALVSFADALKDDVPARRATLDQVAAYLQRHGVSAVPTLLCCSEPSPGERLLRGGVPDVAVAEALLSHAADMQADFIVMGGYGHSRLWELVLGGVTRTMLETMTVPVLMSH